MQGSRHTAEHSSAQQQGCLPRPPPECKQSIGLIVGSIRGAHLTDPQEVYSAGLLQLLLMWVFFMLSGVSNGSKMLCIDFTYVFKIRRRESQLTVISSLPYLERPDLEDVLVLSRSHVPAPGRLAQTSDLCGQLFSWVHIHKHIYV